MTPSEVATPAEAEMLSASRRFMKLSLGLADGLADALRGKVTGAVILMTAFEANHHTLVFAGRAPFAREPRPIPLSALARATGLDAETTRRTVRCLALSGHCETGARGVVADPAPILAQMAKLIPDIHAVLAWVLALDGHKAPRAPAPLGRLDNETLLERLYDRPPRLATLLARMWLRRTLGMGEAFDNDYELMRLFGRINVLNNAHVRDIPDATRLLRRYPTLPDALRRPATVADIAAKGGGPEITVRRRLRRMGEMGLVERRPGGVIVPEHAVLDPRVRGQFTGMDHMRTLLVTAGWL